MDIEKQSTAEAGKVTNIEPGQARSLAISQTGVNTGQQFASLMSALMSDLIEGRITPGVGNAVCNAGGKLLKVVELQAKYGQSGGGSSSTDKILRLT